MLLADGEALAETSADAVLRTVALPKLVTVPESLAALLAAAVVEAQMVAVVSAVAATDAVIEPVALGQPLSLSTALPEGGNEGVAEEESASLTLSVGLAVNELAPVLLTEVQAVPLAVTELVLVPLAESGAEPLGVPELQLLGVPKPEAVAMDEGLAFALPEKCREEEALGDDEWLALAQGEEVSLGCGELLGERERVAVSLANGLGDWEGVPVPLVERAADMEAMVDCEGLPLPLSVALLQGDGEPLIDRDNAAVLLAKRLVDAEVVPLLLAVVHTVLLDVLEQQLVTVGGGEADKVAELLALVQLVGSMQGEAAGDGVGRSLRLLAGLSLASSELVGRGEEVPVPHAVALTVPLAVLVPLAVACAVPVGELLLLPVAVLLRELVEEPEPVAVALPVEPADAVPLPDSVSLPLDELVAPPLCELSGLADTEPVPLPQ